MDPGLSGCHSPRLWLCEFLLGTTLEFRAPGTFTPVDQGIGDGGCVGEELEPQVYVALTHDHSSLRIEVLFVPRLTSCSG